MDENGHQPGLGSQGWWPGHASSPFNRLLFRGTVLSRAAPKQQGTAIPADAPGQWIGLAQVGKTPEQRRDHWVDGEGRTAARSQGLEARAWGRDTGVAWRG